MVTTNTKRSPGAVEGVEPLAELPVQTCLYRNSRDRMVILRCIGPQSYFLEKVIFPFETWSFNAPAEAEVELWCHGFGGAELLERFDSRDLLLDDLAAPQAAVQPIPPASTGLEASARERTGLDVTIDCASAAVAATPALKI
jgi:hypothetical protein